MSRFPAALRTLLVLLLALAVEGRAQQRPARDVLLICVDDLRPELSCMGGAARTPNLDRLAAQGRLFTRHYVQVPTCGASRRALLTGRVPTRSAHLSNGACADLGAQGGSPESFVELFRRAGYATVCLGKISHEPDGLRAAATEGGERRPELPNSWSRVVRLDWPWGAGYGPFFAYADGSSRQRGKSPPFEAAEVDDRGYADGWIADTAVQELERLGAAEQPFLLAVGFYKPHLPFNAPRSYWDLYDPEAFALAPQRTLPAGLELPLDGHASAELLANYGQHPEQRPLPAAYERKLRHGYLAAVSYVDAQVGKLLGALDRGELASSTAVVLWSDHGWHLGDHGLWGKHTPLERALHAPLIVRIPGMAEPGEPCATVVEALDVYPTLVEWAGLGPAIGLDGRSLLPSLADPDAARDGGARSWWRSSGALALSYRSSTHRYVQWSRAGEVVQEELFDHRRDPHEGLSVHVSQPDVLAELRARVEASKMRF